MSEWGHLMILASAGSGKTYALTTRFVKLLAAGAAPERVVALTFTRKAAGEFFDAILTRLAFAAADRDAAVRLGVEIGRPEMAADDFLPLLRSMVDKMPQLNLGTMDGFFSRMVRAFPLELGLGGEFELLEEGQAQQARRRVLSMLFNTGVAGESARQDFIEAFKRATYGVEEKALQRRLDVFLDEHGETFRVAPDASVWGNPQRIWPEGNRWLRDAPALATALEKCRSSLPWEAFNEKQRGVMEGFLAAMEEWEAGSTLPRPANTPVANVLKFWDALQAGPAEMPVGGKKFSFEPKAGRDLAGVVQAILAAEYNRKLEITRGIHAVVRLYEEKYDSEVRRAGRLTFADVQRLLQPVGAMSDAAERRLLMNWRLDARFDHWLLDEFQDTSREQWRILHELIDEAVQDPEAARTFFYVGDVKQAIYGWRGGDARLFREIFEHYNAAQPGAVAEQHLAKSWRSAGPIIEMVNQVMGDGGALGEIVPPVVVDRWIQEWRDHEPARRELSGFAAVHVVEDQAARWAETLGVLRSIEAVRRGLTVAVLVQTNQTGAELAEYLRSEGGLPAVAESDLQIAYDNPFTCALLALLRWAAHPGDSFAEEAVRMTPVADRLRELGWSGAADVARGVLEDVHAHGFAGALARWVERMEPCIEKEGDFSRLRSRQLIDAARVFDETGSRDVDEFLAWTETYSLREAESPGVVRVMTVHKAKGLGFDVVILPDLQGNSVALRRRGLAVHRNAERSVDWVLDLPGKAMAEMDPVLADQMEEDVAEAGYEALCKLYVAMTRAKRALHLIFETVGRSRSKNYPRLLDAALGSEWRRGDASWFQEIEAEEQGSSELVAGSKPLAGDRRRRRRRGQTATERSVSSIRAGGLFEPGRMDAAERGSVVHGLLAEVTWSDEFSESVSVEAWEGREIPRDWIELVLATVAAPAAQSVFQRGDREAVELWREQPFEFTLGDRWISGIFDRVILERDAAGRVRHATVVDFKTDTVDCADNLAAATDRHRSQLEVYRMVLARMTQIPESDVKAQLVFTENQCVVTLD